MTSTVGGSPKNRQKEQNQRIFDSDRGEGVKKFENFADVIYGSPLTKRTEASSSEFQQSFSNVKYLSGVYAELPKKTCL